MVVPLWPILRHFLLEKKLNSVPLVESVQSVTSASLPNTSLLADKVAPEDGRKNKVGKGVRSALGTHIHFFCRILAGVQSWTSRVHLFCSTQILPPETVWNTSGMLNTAY